ncbi:patatin-like phospholipase family protein [Nocardia higoensis]|uniref:Patatin-like phospholipase family protein n=1 Tax=Nocardia higoensis TaxID=228599 RepID=A0ABS0D980_9NOCA|nr:patatin-like phospholipase family protein [Nocardia higoensis]MBF6355006.1 patatin-like phospholipase family protein [Nocardia higoensis]
MISSDSDKNADVVLAGGGVKGIGLVGAVAALLDAGYTFHRVSGTSAGAVVGAVLAAGAKHPDFSSKDLKDIAFDLDYREFLDPGPIEAIPVVGPLWALFRGTGLYRGDYAHEWIAEKLRDLGVVTFDDLPNFDDSLPLPQRYSLAVTVTDVTTGQLVRLPWDYERVYGCSPGAQRVADAVRASMSIPYFFRPSSMSGTQGVVSTLVDGGVLSNFPIDSLDRTDDREPRWPTFGITVLPNLPAGNDDVIPGLGMLRFIGGVRLLSDLLPTMLVGRDQAYLNQPWVSARAIRVDSTDVGVLDFGISDEAKEALYRKGYDAAVEFLRTWDWPKYLKRFRAVPVRE